MLRMILYFGCVKIHIYMYFIHPTIVESGVKHHNPIPSIFTSIYISAMCTSFYTEMCIGFLQSHFKTLSIKIRVFDIIQLQ